MSANKLKFIFHIHTTVSRDSTINPRQLVRYCRSSGIGAIAVCDHNSIEGALAVEKLAEGNPQVIIGEEISTEQGEIIGLFINDKIEGNLGVREAIERIRKQGGLVCLPHPGETLRRSSISKKLAEELIREIDALEAYNSRTIFSRDNEWAERLAKRYRKPMLFGADAHNMGELCGAIVEIEPYNGAAGFLKSLRTTKLQSWKKTGICLQAISIMVKSYRKIRKK